MTITDDKALRAYAKMMNTLDSAHIENMLAENFCYSSQMVFEEIDSKQKFLNYIQSQLQVIRQTGASVYAEMGKVNAYGEEQLCVILAQNNRDNLVGLVLAKVGDGKLTRLDLCIVPSPQQAIRTGEYPK